MITAQVDLLDITAGLVMLVAALRCVLTPSAGGVISESWGPQVGLTPADISFAEFAAQRCNPWI